MCAAEAILVDLGDIRIRKKILADGLDDYLWRQDPETSRLDGSGLEGMTLSEFLGRLQADLESPFCERQWYSLIDASGSHIGTILLTIPVWDSVTAELGITLGRSEHRDHGIGKRALVGFLRYVWNATPLTRVELHTFEWNERARACFLRAGFAEIAPVVRGDLQLLKMEARREWWLMWDGEGRFKFR